MKLRSILLAVLTFLLCTATMSDAAGIREKRPNFIGGEIMGRGYAITANYERFLTNNFGLGGGLMAVGGRGGVVMIMPLYASFVPGEEHSLYLSAGTALLSSGGEFQNYESSLILQSSIGYQFQSQSGFFVRPLFTLNLATGDTSDFLIWPGLTIGGSF